MRIEAQSRKLNSSNNLKENFNADQRTEGDLQSKRVAEEEERSRNTKEETIGEGSDLTQDGNEGKVRLGNQSTELESQKGEGEESLVESVTQPTAQNEVGEKTQSALIPPDYLNLKFLRSQKLKSLKQSPQIEQKLNLSRKR